MPESLMGKIFDEFPDESEWDVIVIGGGPNGLIASAYLARAGLKVITIERRYEIGGGLATEEILFPGCVHQSGGVLFVCITCRCRKAL